MDPRVRALVILAVGAAVGALVAGGALSYMRGGAPASPSLGTQPFAAQAANDGSPSPTSPMAEKAGGNIVVNADGSSFPSDGQDAVSNAAPFAEPPKPVAPSPTKPKKKPAPPVVEEDAGDAKAAETDAKADPKADPRTDDGGSSR